MEVKQMSNIQCPRCKTINEDKSADDPCQHCGTILNAPMSSLDNGGFPPSSAANGAGRIASTNDTAREPIAPDQPAAAVTGKADAGGEKRYE